MYYHEIEYYIKALRENKMKINPVIFFFVSIWNLVFIVCKFFFVGFNVHGIWDDECLCFISFSSGY